MSLKLLVYSISNIEMHNTIAEWLKPTGIAIGEK
ncbi:hypothetical protein VCRA2110O2_30066 [Vibrio crassostreae]|nr:hypothetical protein VCHA44O286_50311 [Vibrio chagasii]CAK2845472.1 hypothetical protein VCRA2110O2_30066 [Vibrio crassostreae]